MKAWHFTSNQLRDGRSIPPIGEKLMHDAPLVMYKSGLHGSKKVLDALLYAPGPYCHRIELSGEIIHDDDKSVAMERTRLWTVDCTQILPRFARLCALDVIHLWDAPKIVVRYLKTGDESLRGAALSAASSAASSAVWDAALYAALSAARSAAWYAAWSAASSAARSAASDKQNRRLTAMIGRLHRGELWTN